MMDELRGLAERDAELGASAQVEARLLTEVRLIGRRRRNNQMRLSALAATLAVAVALPIWNLADREPAPQADQAGVASAGAAGAEITTEFLPLAYSTVPVVNGHLVRMEVPEGVMASFGLARPQSPAGTESTVMADVLVGDDGLARAVRFVLEQPKEGFQ